MEENSPETNPHDCNLLIVQLVFGFSGGSVVKNSPASAGDMGLISGSGRRPGEENGNPIQYSCLGNPMGRGSLVGYSPRGCKKVRYDLASKQQQQQTDF